MKKISWKEVEESLLKNHEVAEECRKLEPEFQELRRLIILKKEKRLSNKNFQK